MTVVMVTTFLLAIPAASSPKLTDKTLPPKKKAAAAVELIQDREFTKGLRAAWSGASWTGDTLKNGLPPGLRLGDITSYIKPPKGYSVHTWPDKGAPVDKGKYWNLTEGLHKGPMEIAPDIQLADGEDLAIYRMEINAELRDNSHSRLRIESMNKLSGTPQLIRGFDSNRHGTLMIYGNTKNEIRNVATDNSSKWAYDTWPHYLVGQNFRQLIDLGRYDSMNFTAEVDVPRVKQSDGWPGGWKNATLYVSALLRRKSNPFACLFLVRTLYTDYPPSYRENIGADQFGQGLFNSKTDNPLVIGAAPSHIEIDYIAALIAAKALNPAIGDPQDYYLVGVGFGWEFVGYYEFASRFAHVSLMGVPVTVPPAK